MVGGGGFNDADELVPKEVNEGVGGTGSDSLAALRSARMSDDLPCMRTYRKKCHNRVNRKCILTVC
jgi:hypothetical protein